MSGAHVPLHIVAVDGLVVNDRDEILMIDSPKRGWEFPGGQVERGETLREALRREIREETGIEAEMGKLVGVYQNVRTNIVVFGFLCRFVGGEPTRSDESLAVEWVPRQQVLERIKTPFIHARMKDKLEFSGEVVFRAYRKEPGDLAETYEVIDESRM